MADYKKVIGSGRFIPRLRTNEIEALTGMVGGEMVFDTTEEVMKVYRSGPGIWAKSGNQNSEENRLISVEYDSTTEESDNIYEYSVITEIIAVVMSQNNGVYASAAVEVGIKDFSTDCLLASGQVDPYAASGTKYKFDVFFPIGEGISSVGFSPVNILVTSTSDPTSTEGNIVFLFKVSNFHIYT